MPVYLNGKKIKDLHYAGRKIKEAWYNGKKVYSSGPPQWAAGTQYNQGDTVLVMWGSSKRYFRCKHPHTAAVGENEPLKTSLWGVYWEEIT